MGDPFAISGGSQELVLSLQLAQIPHHVTSACVDDEPVRVAWFETRRRADGTVDVG